MWGIFGKPLKRAIWNTPGLPAVLTTCVRFSSVLDDACVVCCLFLSTGSCHVPERGLGASESTEVAGLAKIEEICPCPQTGGCLP